MSTSMVGNALVLGSTRIDPPLILAPMAGYTDAVFRAICLRHGCGLVYTEVANAVAIARRIPRTLNLLANWRGEGPVTAHLFGTEPDIMVEAARVIAAMGRFIAIDLNCGCPVRKIVAKGAGAALMRDPGRIAVLIRALRAGSGGLPITVKTRIGISPQALNIMEIAHAVEEAGAAALAVHARPASAKHAGPADWRWLARLKQERRIPIIGNGGVQRPEDAERMLAETGVDAVMIGRAAVGNPWIFNQISARLKGVAPSVPDWTERRRLVLEHLDALAELKRREDATIRRNRPQPDTAAVLHFRAHLYRYVSGMPGWARVRRDLSVMNNYAQVHAALDHVFSALAHEQNSSQALHAPNPPES